MITIRISKTLRGEIFLPSLPGNSLKANNIHTISLDQFYSADVQSALKKKLVSVENQDVGDDEDTSQVKHKVKNVSKMTLSVAPIKLHLGPAEVTYLTEDQLAHPQLQIVLDKGWIQVIEEKVAEKVEIKDGKSEDNLPSRIEIDKDGNAVEITPLGEPREFEAHGKKFTIASQKTQVLGKAIKVKKGRPSKQVQSDAKPIEEEDKDTGPKTNMSAWDGRNKKLLNKEDSSKEARQEYAGGDHKPIIQTGEIDFTDTKTEELPVKTAKVASKKSGKKGIAPVGKARSPAGSDADNFVYANESKNISFVDQEQEQERIKEHPKSDVLENNGEIE